MGHVLLAHHNGAGLLEAGCDEAGRGCLAGAVYAAAVILPPDYHNEALNDSKQLTDARRRALRPEIERDALAWAIGVAEVAEIDRYNILNASILAMHRALDGLQICPECIIVDGNRFKPYVREVLEIPHTTIVKGDGKYLSIAAASVVRPLPPTERPPTTAKRSNCSKIKSRAAAHRRCRPQCFRRHVR